TDDGHGAARKKTKAFKQALHFGLVEAGGGLVEHEQAGRGCERARELEHALLAIGERSRLRRRPAFEPDEAEELDCIRAAASMVAPERGCVNDVLPGWDVVMDVRGRDDVAEH